MQKQKQNQKVWNKERKWRKDWEERMQVRHGASEVGSCCWNKRAVYVPGSMQQHFSHNVHCHWVTGKEVGLGCVSVALLFCSAPRMPKIHPGIQKILHSRKSGKYSSNVTENEWSPFDTAWDTSIMMPSSALNWVWCSTICVHLSESRWFVPFVINPERPQHNACSPLISRFLHDFVHNDPCYAVAGPKLLEEKVPILGTFSQNTNGKGWCYVFTVTCMGAWLFGCQFKNFLSFFLAWFSKTKPNHWTKQMANTWLDT